jgi:ATP-binding cassette subfamily F protein uup
VQTLGVLEEYLEDFNGCVIVVSHDRYFLDRTVNTIFSFESNGTLRQYPGNYSLYLDYKKAEKEREEDRQREATKVNDKSAPSGPSSSTPRAAKSSAGSQGKKLSYKEKREYEHLETHIPTLEADKETIEKRLYNDAPSNYEEVTRLSEQLAALSAQIDAATERWMELAERLEG